MPGTDQKVDYPYSEAGQDLFAQDLVKTLEAHPTCTGLFWWWMEYNAKGTSLSGWYNAPLFDSRTGRATKALETICSFANENENGVGEIVDSQEGTQNQWFDLLGRPVAEPSVPGLYIHNRRVVAVP